MTARPAAVGRFAWQQRARKKTTSFGGGHGSMGQAAGRKQYSAMKPCVSACRRLTLDESVEEDPLGQRLSKGQGTLVCVSHRPKHFILAFSFARISLLSIPSASVRRFITPLRCGPNSFLLFLLLLSICIRCFGQFGRPSTPSGCPSHILSFPAPSAFLSHPHLSRVSSKSCCPRH